MLQSASSLWRRREWLWHGDTRSILRSYSSRIARARCAVLFGAEACAACCSSGIPKTRLHAVAAPRATSAVAARRAQTASPP